MKFIELIDILKDMLTTEHMVNKELPDSDFSLVGIFMKEIVSVDSEVKLFNYEEISPTQEMYYNGIKYIELFPIEMAQKIVEAFSKTYPTESNTDIAKRVVEYRINDA